MKTDVIHVTNAGEGMTGALEQTSAAAVYRGLTGKDAIHLRLLAEEMLGMFRQITGKTEADFWLDSEGKRFELHLSARPRITDGMRRDLLSVSSSGKNAAAVGVMGKLRDIFESAFDAAELGTPAAYSRHYMQGLLIASNLGEMDSTALALSAAVSAGAMDWSMQKYKAAVEQEKTEDDAVQEEWDELEKSIVAKLADDVIVGVKGDRIELVIVKAFKK